MIPEERKTEICNIVNTRKAVTVSELMTELDASEATIRRDLTELSKKGLIKKVHGGAVTIQNMITTDYKVSEKASINIDDKERIARYAAELITDSDLVYIDAGTTTSFLIEYINAPNAVFVTNAPFHAAKLASRGFSVYLTGGRVKSSTEALIGSMCLEALQRYNFTLGFFGTNAVSTTNGFTTPDPDEALIKECAITHTLNPYILCDKSKFNLTSSVQFAKYGEVPIITTGKIPSEYKKESGTVII